MTPELISGHTYHRRFGGPENAFRYGVDYVLLEPEAEARGPGLFSRNRFNLAAVHDRDHGGPRGEGSGAAWVREVLRAHGLELERHRVLLLAQPRVLGHVFNPVCFWMVVDADDALRAVIVEVNNTFGDRHSYLCHHDDLRPIRPRDTLGARKVFHVSPFQPVDGEYAFRFDLSPGHVGVRIDYRHGNGGLLATLTGKRAPLTSRALLAAALRRPVGSLRVIALIYAQAVKLRAKGAVYRTRPAPPAAEVTR
jgi:DUF1365 family protein